MRLIIPMAGLGKRMRPQTLTIPKPLIPVAGKPIVSNLIEEIYSVCKEKIEEIIYITGRFGIEIEEVLLDIAKQHNATGKICYQDIPLGTAHAILCAEKYLKGPIIIAFADTLFFSNSEFNFDHDVVIWVHQVKNPSQYGVVKVNQKGIITEFYEKPKKFVSDLAIIGIYYFKKGEILLSELKYLIDNEIKVNGEYQLTDALQNMKNKKYSMSIGKVSQWLDCGNKEATLFANKSLLLKKQKSLTIPPTAKIVNSIVIQPCFIGQNVEIKNSVVGPFVSINNNTTINESVISNSIIQMNAQINNSNIRDSMIGNNTIIYGTSGIVNLGDYSTVGS